MSSPWANIQGHLGRRGADVDGNGLHLVDDAQIALEVLSSEARGGQARLPAAWPESALDAKPDVVPGGHLVALSHPIELVDRICSYVEQDAE
jgi:hypothetical protein